MDAITRRHALLMISAGAASVAVPALSVPAAPFDAAGYVALWRRYGNVVTIAPGLKGRPSISIYFPDEAEFPPFAELNQFATGEHQDPSWKQTVVDLLEHEEADADGGEAPDHSGLPGEAAHD